MNIYQALQVHTAAQHMACMAPQALNLTFKRRQSARARERESDVVILKAFQICPVITSHLIFIFVLTKRCLFLGFLCIVSHFLIVMSMSIGCVTSS
jgi:hypothetical protein